MQGHIPAVVVPEEGQDLLEGLVLRLGHLLVGEYPEDGQEHAERQERVVLQGSLDKKRSRWYIFRKIITPERLFCFLIGLVLL